MKCEPKSSVGVWGLLNKGDDWKAGTHFAFISPSFFLLKWLLESQWSSYDWLGSSPEGGNQVLKRAEQRERRTQNINHVLIHSN